MKVFEFELDSEDMKAISSLNQNLRKIVPINKLKVEKIQKEIVSLKSMTYNSALVYIFSIRTSCKNYTQVYIR